MVAAEAGWFAPLQTLRSPCHHVLSVQLGLTLFRPSFGARLESSSCCRMRVVRGAVEGQEV